MMRLLQAFQTVADAVGEGLIIANMDGEFIVFNSEAERMLGIGPTSGGPDTWPTTYGISDVNGPVAPEDVPLARAFLGETIRGRLLLCRTPNVPDGLHIRCNAHPLFEKDTQIGAIVTFADISEMSNQSQVSKRELAVMLRRFHAWTSSTPDLMCIVSSSGIYKDVVGGREVPAIAPLDEILGKHVSEVGDPVYATTTLQYVQTALQTGRVGVWRFQIPERENIEFEARFIPSGGPNCPSPSNQISDDACRGCPYRAEMPKCAPPDGNGEPLCAAAECLIIVRDVSGWHFQKQQLETAVAGRTAELQASNDELRQFAYAASHDLREPLAKVKAFGDRLTALYSDVLDEKGLNYLGVMQSAADRMMLLIDDLLEYSRVGRAQDSQFVSIDLNLLMAEVVTLFSEKADGAEIQCSSDLPTINGDRSQCYTLFQNLLGNSLKFHKPGQPARIWVTAAPEGRHEVVTVRDNGIGFDPEYAEKIFLIFERLHTRFDYPGTGIGLALCRKIVERHGGFISGDGRPNEGATFRVGFPRRSN